jgi:hypothetical protein
MITPMIIFERHPWMVGHIAADGLKQHIDLAGRGEGREEFGCIEAVGTKVMEHDAAVVKQGLDIDKFKRLVVSLDHALAEFKTPRSFQAELARPFQIRIVSRPEDSSRFAKLGRGGVFRNHAQPG